jgi:hypothetical protein
VVDVGSEWRTFSNDKDSKDMSRVGAVEVHTQTHTHTSLYLILECQFELNVDFKLSKGSNIGRCRFEHDNWSSDWVGRFRRERLALVPQ